MTIIVTFLVPANDWPASPPPTTATPSASKFSSTVACHFNQFPSDCWADSQWSSLGIESTGGVNSQLLAYRCRREAKRSKVRETQSVIQTNLFLKGYYPNEQCKRLVVNEKPIFLSDSPVPSAASVCDRRRTWSCTWGSTLESGHSCACSVAEPLEVNRIWRVTWESILENVLIIARLAESALRGLTTCPSTSPRTFTTGHAEKRLGGDAAASTIAVSVCVQMLPFFN